MNALTTNVPKKLLQGNKIIGVIGNRAKGDEIGTLFVDGKYHRKGIATELMNRMVSYFSVYESAKEIISKARL